MQDIVYKLVPHLQDSKYWYRKNSDHHKVLFNTRYSIIYLTQIIYRCFTAYLWTIATLYTSYFLPVEEKKRRQEFAAKHGLSDEVKEGILP